MAGKGRKASNAIAGHRQKAASFSVVPNRADERPPAPVAPNARALLVRTRDVWKRFWASELSDHVDRLADLHRVERWITYVDEWERAMRAYQSARMVLGSMGQVVVSPAWRVVMDCEARLKEAEEGLGMNPLARARLGLTIGAAGNSLDELNRRMAASDEPTAKVIAGAAPIEGEWSAL